MSRVIRVWLAALVMLVSTGNVLCAQQLALNGTTPPTTVTIAAGSTVSVDVSNGPGNATDWIGLYSVGSSDTSYVDWRYLSGTTAPPATGLSAATLTWPLPVTAGDYELRLFDGNSAQRIATSAVVTVIPSTTQLTINGIAPPATATVILGTVVSVGITNGPGNATDWVALAPADASDATYVDWRYLNGATTPPAAGVSSATIAFQTPATPGAYEVRFYVNNANQRLTTSGPLVVTPSPAQLTVNSVAAPTPLTVDAGSTALVAVSDGPANATDWVGLYAAGTADAQPLSWNYLNGSSVPPAIGSAAASLNFLIPASAGSYEFRFFSDNGYTRLATSGAVIVAASPAQLIVNGVVPPVGAVVPAGSPAAVTVSDGPGNPTDWLTLAVTGSPDGSYIDWRYLNGTTVPPASGVSGATVTFTAPVAAGTYEARLFAANSTGRIATSGPITVTAPTATLAIDGIAPPTPVSVTAGALISLQIAGGPGNTTDWVTLAPSGSAMTTYVAWQYLNGLLTPPASALTGATLTFLAPATPGTFEFRFFAANGYSELASVPLTVVPSPASIMVNGVSEPGTVSVAPGEAITATIANGPGSPTDWVTLAAVASPDSSYFAWQYLNGATTPPTHGLNAATLTFTAPTTTGTYEIRLYANNTFTRLTASATISVSDQSASTTVALTSPAPNTTATLPASITLSADVTSNLAIASVNFYAGSLLIGSSTTAPYQVTWVPPAPGSYDLTASAIDTVNRVTTSAAVPITIVALPPAVATVSPTTAAAGTLVTITGSGFGTTQGAGVVWLGTRTGTVSSWSDTQIVASVANGSQSGTAYVRQYGVSSAAVPFTVQTAAVTTVSPDTGPAGTSVIIAGSGFGATQGGGSLWIGGASATVTSWSDTQIVATVPAGAVSGDLVVLQGGVLSNAVAFTVTGGAPQIYFVSPNPAEAGSEVTIYGTGFGTSQGGGSVRIGGANAPVSAWSDTQISATVPAGALTGVLKVQQNGSWSNAFTFTVTVVSGSQITLSPNLVNMEVGETRPVLALDANGAAVTGLTWTSSDPTVATISTDPRPVVTAIGTGSTTIQAGAASMDVTVYAAGALPNGAVLWSVPGPAAGVADIKVAVPSETGTDVFAIGNDGTVQAIAGDGTVAWTVSSPIPDWFDSRADFQGGLVAYTSDSIVRLDGASGQSTTLYANSNAETASIGLAQPAIHPEGKVLTVDYHCRDFCENEDPDDSAAVVGMDIATGAHTFRAPLANSTYTFTQNDAAFCQNLGGNGTSTQQGHAFLNNQLVVAADGYVYLSYLTYHSTATRQRAVAQLYPDAAYDLWDQMLQYTTDRDWTNALATVDAIQALIVTSPDTTWGQQYRVDFTNQNYESAVLHENAEAPNFRRLCDSTGTLITKLHFMRVNAAGASDDVVVKQWTATDQVINTLNAGNTLPYPYTTVETHTGPSDIRLSEHNITNADQGALYSWQVNLICSESGTFGSRTYTQVDACPTVPEDHLTTFAHDGNATDRLWTPGVAAGSSVESMFQLEEGLFAGIVERPDGLSGIVFDSSGQVHSTFPGLRPISSRRGGGLYASGDTGAYVFDARGAAIGAISLPQTQSWLGAVYRQGSVEDVHLPPMTLGLSYAPTADGNLSGTDSYSKPTVRIDAYCRGVDHPIAEYVGALHCYIVTQDAAGEVLTIEGGESTGQPDGTLAVAAKPGTNYPPNDPSKDLSYYSAADPNVARDIGCLKTTAALLNSMMLPYHFLGPNSNSTVAELLRVCGRRTVLLPPKAFGGTTHLLPR
jgi:uncharacterized protein (TIGR03437 family)